MTIGTALSGARTVTMTLLQRHAALDDVYQLHEELMQSRHRVMIFLSTGYSEKETNS